MQITNELNDLHEVWDALCEAGNEVVGNILDSFSRFCFHETILRETIGESLVLGSVVRMGLKDPYYVEE